jgi:hypothetical protein
MKKLVYKNKNEFRKISQIYFCSKGILFLLPLSRKWTRIKLQTYNPTTQEDLKFKASLGYIGFSMTVWAAQQDPLSKKE